MIAKNIPFFQVEQSTLEFEDHLIKVFLDSNNNDLGVQALVNVARSFNDIASATILSDTSMIVLGFSIVFTYVVMMLGKWHFIENRVRIDEM